MLEKEDFKQIETIVRNIVHDEVSTIIDAKFDEKLDPIKQRLDCIESDIKDIKIQLERLRNTETEDVAASYNEIDKLKRRVADLENQVRLLQTA